MKWARVTIALAAAIVLAGCINLQIPGSDTLFVKGEPFIVRGTAAVADNGGPCLVWYADNGITYHLFQGSRIANADFDHITTPGVTSRLEIATRNDLEVACQLGTIVEVQSILEVAE